MVKGNINLSKRWQMKRDLIRDECLYTSQQNGGAERKHEHMINMLPSSVTYNEGFYLFIYS